MEFPGGVRAFLRGAALLTGAIFAMLLGAHPAAAHPALVRSDPPVGATLTEPPATLRLWFSEAISPRGSSARLLSHGEIVAGTRVSVLTDVIEVSVPRLPDGSYALAWQVLGTGTGHPVSGTLVFGVGVPPPESGAVAGPSLRWLRLGVLAGLVGALTMLLVPRRREGAIIAVGCAALGVFVNQAELGSSWGWPWLAREVLLLALLPTLAALLVTGRPAYLVAAGSGTLTLIGIEAAGPAAAPALAVDVLFLFAGSLVLGVAPLLVLADHRRPLLRVLAVGLGLLLITGLDRMARGWGAEPPAGEETSSGSVADLVVTISATPNRPGVNGFTVIAVSTRRPPPAIVDSARLELPSGTLPLREVGPQRYYGATRLDVSGPLRIDAVLQRAGQLVTVPVPWRVDLPGKRVAPYADVLALSLIAGAAVVTSIRYVRRRRNEAN